MSANTNIEWTDATVNWWAGCTAISPACDNCYAQKMAGRLWGTQWGPGQPRHQFTSAAETLRALDRKAARLGTKLSVFHNSLSDMFDNEVPDVWRMAAFSAMAETQNLIHLVLTKRIGNVRPYLQRDGQAFDLIVNGRVRLGITICNQEEADRDIPKLLRVPAAKRFLSCEPLLGPLRLNRLTALDYVESPEGAEVYPLRGIYAVPDCDWPGPKLDWVIVGGESGHGARPMHPDWARSLRDQCRAAGVPFMFKQWGEWAPPTTPVRCANYCVNGIDGETDGNGHTTAGTCLECGGTGEAPYVKVGKKSAGRLLDGRTWDEVPA